jgi:hypothetical protein
MDFVTDKEDKSQPVPVDLTLARESSRELDKEIRDAKRLGEICLKQAKWIGLSRYEVFYFVLQLPTVLNYYIQI